MGGVCVRSEEIAGILGEEVCAVEWFEAGQIGDIYRVKTKDTSYILKTSQPSDNLQIEACMLNDMKKYPIPVPEIFAVSDSYLLMEYIKPAKISKEQEGKEAAKILSKLHSISNDAHMYGYYYDTTIGPFRQKNEQTQYNWVLFLSQMRILPMAKLCYDKGAISATTLKRLESLCGELYRRIDMASITPSLLHGDLWSGNILFNMNGAVLIDPALYFGDREMELAFILMFQTFGKSFFEAYTKQYALSEDFYSLKVPLYQIYPLLVHVALYGSSYTKELEETLKKLKV